MYLLDTNILSEFVKKQPNPKLISKLRSKSPSELFTSSICVMELRFGSKLREDFDVFWKQLEEEILSRINIFPVSHAAGILAGDILAELRKRDQIIGIEDVLIAASALSNRCTMVTANIRHYSRIKGLAVENWLEPSST